ncbi:hypothetical protein A2U01_0090577, partial [Trifolium medium]|nr:hypothetical protein [Trifolium medium]
DLLALARRAARAGATRRRAQVVCAARWCVNSGLTSDGFYTRAYFAQFFA